MKGNIIIEVIQMPDYKKMYYTMIQETEKAINTLIKAQQKCEELYMKEKEPIHIVKKKKLNEKKRQ